MKPVQTNGQANLKFVFQIENLLKDPIKIENYSIFNIFVSKTSLFYGPCLCNRLIVISTVSPVMSLTPSVHLYWLQWCNNSQALRCILFSPLLFWRTILVFWKACLVRAFLIYKRVKVSWFFCSCLVGYKLAPLHSIIMHLAALCLSCWMSIQICWFWLVLKNSPKYFDSRKNLLARTWIRRRFLFLYSLILWLGKVRSFVEVPTTIAVNGIFSAENDKKKSTSKVSAHSLIYLLLFSSEFCQKWNFSFLNFF